MNNVLFFHGKTTDGYNYTIAGTVDKRLLRKSLINMGIAVCSNNDNFSRKRGRLISEGRLLCDREVNGKKLIKVKATDGIIKTFVDNVSSYNTFTRNTLLKEFSL
jgi:hypothetical protein